MFENLHKLPFYTFEKQVPYKVHQHGTPVMHVGSTDNSKRRGYCGSLEGLPGYQFECDEHAFGLALDQADRDVTTNIAVRDIARPG